MFVQASRSDTDDLTGISERGREAAERGIACQLLSVTYDGSPLVRAELAAALARVAAGHSVLFQVCLLATASTFADQLSLYSVHGALC